MSRREEVKLAIWFDVWTCFYSIYLDLRHFNWGKTSFCSWQDPAKFHLFNQWISLLQDRSRVHVAKWCSQLRWAAIALVAAVGGSEKRQNSLTKSLAALWHVVAFLEFVSSISMKISRAVMKCFLYVNICHLSGLWSANGIQRPFLVGVL